MVANAAIQATIHASSRGQELELLGRGLGDHACCRPPAMSPAIQLTQTRPITITIICTKPVVSHRPHATEQGIDEDDAGADQHALVHRHRVARGTLNTSPSAVTCAATQPR